jgi:hypothetical protein
MSVIDRLILGPVQTVCAVNAVYPVVRIPTHVNLSQSYEITGSPFPLPVSAFHFLEKDASLKHSTSPPAQEDGYHDSKTSPSWAGDTNSQLSSCDSGTENQRWRPGSGADDHFWRPGLDAGQHCVLDKCQSEAGSRSFGQLASYDCGTG